jgi:hypothetical protein
MNEKNLEKFDPTVAELTAMVEATKNITATDLKDKVQLAVVRENRIALKGARVKITKIGKELRADAVTFQNAVIAKEKELIGIIEPEEDRLSEIEEQAKAQAIREGRLEELPERKERLAQVESYQEDEKLLAMDGIQFETFYNEKVAEHNENTRIQVEKAQQEAQEKLDAKRRDEQNKIEAEQEKAQAKIYADRKALDDEKAKVDADKAEIARQKEIKEAQDKARTDEKNRIEFETKEKVAKEKTEACLLAKEKKTEDDKLLKRKAFIDFRNSYGWTEKTKANFKLEETSEGFVLYKKLGIFNK